MSIKIENTVLPSPEQWEATVRGARNPLNSWARMDSKFRYDIIPSEEGLGYIVKPIIELGPNDHDLLTRLAKGGSVHAKYRRMLPITVDITAPLYWWKETDQYKIGTTTNSCSTMHKIHSRDLNIEDFSYEHLFDDEFELLKETIRVINSNRREYLDEKDDAVKKRHWDNMIQLLPSSYNQKRTLFMNYEVLVDMHRDRKHHKLLEWRDLCSWIESLPYSELITGECDEEKIYSFDFCGHHGEVYVPANATETEINAAIFEEMSKMVEITKKYEWTVDKKN